MKSQINNHSKYYEIAFSFINAKKQVELFEKFILKYSKIEGIKENLFFTYE